MDGWIGGRMERRVGGRKDMWVDGWTDGWVNGGMKGRSRQRWPPLVAGWSQSKGSPVCNFSCSSGLRHIIGFASLSVLMADMTNGSLHSFPSKPGCSLRILLNTGFSTQTLPGVELATKGTLVHHSSRMVGSSLISHLPQHLV